MFSRRLYSLSAIKSYDNVIISYRNMASRSNKKQSRNKKAVKQIAYTKTKSKIYTKPHKLKEFDDQVIQKNNIYIAYIV